MDLFSVKTEKYLATFILPVLPMYSTSPREIDKAPLNELKSKLTIIVCRENIIGLKHSAQP
jgi:hypothetical protein